MLLRYTILLYHFIFTFKMVVICRVVILQILVKKITIQCHLLRFKMRYIGNSEVLILNVNKGLALKYSVVQKPLFLKYANGRAINRSQCNKLKTAPCTRFYNFSKIYFFNVISSESEIIC